MTSRPDYIRYLESATQAEYEERLRSEGYTVHAEERYGDVQFDLVARKGSKSVAYEFKAGRTPKNDRSGIERLQQAAKRAGLEFHIVLVNPPPRVNIEIEDLSQKLKRSMQRSIPADVQSLSDRTEISQVYDLRFSEIRVGSGEIRLEGMGTVEVELSNQIDSHVVEGGSDAFPFHFKAVLSADGQLIKVDELTVDTTTYKN